VTQRRAVTGVNVRGTEPYGALAGQPAQAAEPGAGLPVAVVVGTGVALPDEAGPADPVAAEPVPAALPVAPAPAAGAELLAAPHPAASAAINIAAAESVTRALACVMVIASFLRNTL